MEEMDTFAAQDVAIVAASDPAGSASEIDEISTDVIDVSPPITPSADYNRGIHKRRLLRGLHRISSSSSILKLSRSSSAAGGYRGTGRGSISCISLSSSSVHFDGADSPRTDNGFSTPPTSLSNRSGQITPVSDDAGRVRFRSHTTSSARIPTSVPLPAEIKLAARPATAGTPLDSSKESDLAVVPTSRTKARPRRQDFDFWNEMPTELKIHILQFLKPKQIVRCSSVSKAWHRMCFDGQLWAELDTAEYYRDIPADALATIIKNAGPFARDLNLRGCVQLWDRWRALNLSDACRNLENLSLEGCRIDRNSIHSLIYQNPRLVHINLSGLAGVTNSSMKIIAQQCPKLQLLNISWCCNVDARGAMKVVASCPELSDLRAGEIRGLEDTDFVLELFKRNTLERLTLVNCESLTDEALTVLVQGVDSETDYMTGRKIVPPRRLRHLDLSRCRNITDDGLLALAHNVPHLEGLQLSKCHALSDTSLISLLGTLSRLTHLDLEELDLLTNATLQQLARSPCKSTLQHLTISYCENLGDVGMLPVIQECQSLCSLDLDNTRISDLVLIEAAAQVRRRFNSTELYNTMTRTAGLGLRTLHTSTNAGAAAGAATTSSSSRRTHAQAHPHVQALPRPRIGLRMVVYDCQNVTWTGIREVLSRNAEIRRPGAGPLHGSALFSSPALVTSSSTSHRLSVRRASQIHGSGVRHAPSTHAAPTFSATVAPQTGPSHPQQIIALKVFYGYQPTVTEHTRRVLRGDLAAASRLERKWAEYMMASEEAGAPGGFGIMGGFVGALGVGGGLAGRRRRRRAREAAMMHADEEEGGAFGFGMGMGGAVAGPGGVGRRRRARSGGCIVM